MFYFLFLVIQHTRIYIYIIINKKNLIGISLSFEKQQRTSIPWLLFIFFLSESGNLKQ